MQYVAMPSSDSIPDSEPIQVVSELEPVDPRQLGLGNASTVGTSQVSKFFVTTTVRDVRRGFFKDGRDPSNEHEGIVVVLYFEFGTYSVDEVTIRIDIDRDEEDESDTTEKNLVIKARYPSKARGPLTEKSITQKVAGSIAPSVANVSGGSVSFERTAETTRLGAVSLESWTNGKESAIWKLKQDRNLKAGAPKTLACAVLLQTDGLLFELSVEFTAPLFGRLYKAKPKVVIGKEHLWERKSRDSWEAGMDWRDFDSETFKIWVRRRTENGWAETPDYSDAAG